MVQGPKPYSACLTVLSRLTTIHAYEGDDCAALTGLQEQC